MLSLPPSVRLFVATQAVLKTPELAWLASGFNQLRGRPALAEVTDA